MPLWLLDKPKRDQLLPAAPREVANGVEAPLLQPLPDFLPGKARSQVKIDDELDGTLRAIDHLGRCEENDPPAQAGDRYQLRIREPLVTQNEAVEKGEFLGESAVEFLSSGSLGRETCRFDLRAVGEPGGAECRYPPMIAPAKADTVER